MYRLINEDNTLVKDYPAPEIYKTLSEKEKENIQIFKDEIEKFTLKEGLGRVSVNVSYEGLTLEKAFIIKNRNGYSITYYDEKINEISLYLKIFSKKNNMYDFFLQSYISFR